MVEAIGRWTEELARDPRSLAFVPLAEALRRRRRHDEAFTVTLRGLERHPYLPDAHDLLARLCADTGDERRARDEWETALRLDPRHAGALKGLGFLSYRVGDLVTARRLLHAALEVTPGDAGARRALARVEAAAGRRARTPVASPPPVRDGTPDAATPAPQRARELFASLLGDGERTALLIDDDGLVLAGAYVDGDGRDAADEIGAELSGIGDEASRALEHLGLGAWQALLAEARDATVALAPVQDGATVLVAAARETSVGLVRRLLGRARQRAADWLGALR